MNRKGFVNIISVIVIVVLLGVVGYFTFVKKFPTLTPTPIGDPVIRVLSPNGGEKLVKGTRVIISWEGLMANPPFRIKLWKGSELIQSIAFNYFSSSPYYWDISASLAGGNDYKIEVLSGDFSDKSDATFSISSL